MSESESYETRSGAGAGFDFESIGLAAFEAGEGFASGAGHVALVE